MESAFPLQSYEHEEGANRKKNQKIQFFLRKGGFQSVAETARSYILMHDGETFSPIIDPGYDTITANILAREPLSEGIRIVDNPDNLDVWSLDERCLGEFLKTEDAMWALSHAVYAPERLLGYSIDEEEDMSPWCYQVFDSKLNLLAEHTFGGHKPGEENWQQASVVAPGERAYAIDWFGSEQIVFPCEVVGPITEEDLRQWHKESECAPANFEEYLEELWDWDVDCTTVRPLVRLTNENGEELPQLTQVARIYLFPFK